MRHVGLFLILADSAAAFVTSLHNDQRLPADFAHELQLVTSKGACHDQEASLWTANGNFSCRPLFGARAEAGAGAGPEVAEARAGAKAEAGARGT